MPLTPHSGIAVALDTIALSSNTEKTIGLAADLQEEWEEWIVLTEGIRQMQYRGKDLGERLLRPDLDETLCEFQVSEISLDHCRIVVEGGPDAIQNFGETLRASKGVAINGGYYVFSFWYQSGREAAAPSYRIIQGEHIQQLRSSSFR